MMQNKKPHVHAKFIKLWSDGETIQWYDLCTGTWGDVKDPSWRATVVYRVKPDPVYPKSNLPTSEIEYMLSSGPSYMLAIRNIVDAAVKQYMIDNNILPKE